MKIAIYGSRRQEGHFESIATLLKALTDAGAALLMHAKLYDYLKYEGGLALGGVTRTVTQGATADRALSIGGDGTFLRTVRWVGRAGIPILGVNTGHLGYLTAYELDDVTSVVNALVHDDCAVEERTLLEVEAPGILTGDRAYALNEVAILKTDTSSMITMETCINDMPLATYRADGLLISTPTGSTGYNLSVGGPIVDPSARVFTITPIAAHALTMRPLVIADDVTVTVTTTCRSRSYMVSLDGRWEQVEAGSSITIRRAPFDIRIIVRCGHLFSDILRDKLLWGV